MICILLLLESLNLLEIFFAVSCSDLSCDFLRAGMQPSLSLHQKLKPSFKILPFDTVGALINLSRICGSISMSSSLSSTSFFPLLFLASFRRAFHSSLFKVPRIPYKNDLSGREPSS